MNEKSLGQIAHDESNKYSWDGLCWRDIGEEDQAEWGAIAKAVADVVRKQVAAELAHRDTEIERLNGQRRLMQSENGQLKARPAHSGVELQRAVADERDACMRLCLSEMKNPFSKDHNNGLQHAADAIRSRNYPEAWNARAALVQQVPLTDEQIDELIDDGTFFESRKTIVRSIEAMHGITGAKT